MYSPASHAEETAPATISNSRMTVVRCTQADSIKAAACQKNALDGAGPELKDEVGKLMQLCIDKFAAKGQPPAGMPQRRPG